MTSNDRGRTMKDTKEVLRDYHKKLSEIKVRFPNEEESGCDLITMAKDRAYDLGFVNAKARKGEHPGSMNAYILSLIEKDLQQAGKLDKIETISSLAKSEAE